MASWGLFETERESAFGYCKHDMQHRHNNMQKCQCGQSKICAKLES